MTTSNTDGLITGQRRFVLDDDILPQTPWRDRVHYQNSGRQIVRTSAGVWLCAFVFDRMIPGETWLALSVSRDSSATQGKDFHDAILLVGKANKWFSPLVPYEGDLLGQVVLSLDDGDRLSVMYDAPGGVMRITADASGDAPHAALADGANWSQPEIIAPQGAAICEVIDGEPYYILNDTLHGGGGELAGVMHPSLHRDGNGVLHAAFERDRRVFYAKRENGSWSQPEMVAYFCATWPSIATTADGRIVIVYQGEGKVDLQRDLRVYDTLRPGGGSTISYAVHDGNKWQVKDYLRSSEILLKRRPASSLRAGVDKFLPRMEEFWRPSLSVDRHGCVWMFYLNTTRRHVYWARFQGETFGTHHEARGAYDRPSRNLLVQKDATQSGAIGFITAAAGDMYFDAIDVPTYTSGESRRVMFMDNLEVDRAMGVEHRIGKWQKHEANPLWGWMATSDDVNDQVSWVQVYPAAGGYEMHYMANDTALRSNFMPGRLFSKDGLKWEKREPFDMNTLTLNGKPFSHSFWRPMYLEDKDEPDPSRRFKGLLGAYRFEREIELRTWDVVTSPDGLAWHTEPNLEPVVLGDISCAMHLFRDDADADASRRYKAVMLKGSAAGRSVCIFTSPDLIHWQRMYWLRQNPDDPHAPVSPYPTGPIMIDPDAAENPWEEEVHDACLWRDNGMLIAHYDAFYFGGNQHINKALAMSRDGRHYWRVRRGEINLPHGACGEWDNGRLRTCVPIRVGDEWRLYYCGMPAGYFGDADKDDPLHEKPGPPAPFPPMLQKLQRPWRLGLATLRAEGHGYFQLQRERDGGEVVSIPFDYAGGRLVVNGVGLGEGVSVAWLDNAGRVVPGFGAGDCRFAASDGVAVAATWPGGEPPHGRSRLRFVFKDLAAKLYGFGFDGS